MRFVLLGIAVGSMYSLTAHGLVLIYRGSGLVSFAQGAFGMVGAFLYYRATEDRGWSALPAWCVALLVPAALGVLTHVLIMTRLRNASNVVRLAATLGVMFFLIAVGRHLWGENLENVESPLPSALRKPFGGNGAITEDRLWLIVIALVLTTLLWAAYRWTRFGHETEAVAENEIAAASLGLSPNRVAIANWMVGSLLAAVTGVLIAPIITLGVASIAFVVLRALAAALIGGFRSFWLTYAGAVGIGITESVLGRYIEDRGVFGGLTSPDGLFLGTFTAQSMARSAAFVLIIVALVARGRALPARSELFDRLPALGSGRMRPLPTAIVALLGIAVLLALPLDWASAFVISLSVAIVCLSVVVVTGYVGQLSLAQMALAGFGVWAAGRLNDAYGWPLLLAAVAGIVITVPLGVLTAVPALRTRGVNLAVLTFGMAVVIDELVLKNSALTGGLSGTRIDRPTLAGVEIDGFYHPGRYAVLVLICLLISAFVVCNLRRSRSGRRMIAVRNNERAAAALGISVSAIKIRAFALGAALATIGGILLAFRQENIDFAAFQPFASIEVLVYTVIGGVGMVLGPLLAAPFALGGVGGEIIKTFGLQPTDLDWLSGLILIGVLLVNPDGLAAENVRVAKKAWGALRARTGGPAVSPTPSDPPRDSAAHDALPAGEGRHDRGDDAQPALEVGSLTVRFGGVVAVDDVSLAVQHGEIVGLIGPNGAGKTTFIDAVTGFVGPARSSEIRLNGEGITSRAAHVRARAGLSRSFQSLELFDDLTVRDNLLAACDGGHSTRAFARDLFSPRKTVLPDAALSAIDEFGLQGDLDVTPDQLAYGRRRLVAIARAVASSPEVLLLDEPAAGLSDPESAELGQLIQRLAHRSGLAILLVEHDMELVMTVSDRVAVLDFGRKIADAPPAVVAADPVVVSAYLGEPEGGDVGDLTLGPGGRT